MSVNIKIENAQKRYGDNIIVLVKIKTESEKDYSYKTLYQKYYYYIDISFIQYFIRCICNYENCPCQ